jgi:tryptophan-rich hypothetical protein
MNARPQSPSHTPLHPKQLPLSKWTAAQPVDREKHFIVTRLIEPEIPGAPVVEIELQAVHSGRVQRLPWRALADQTVWRRGWV